MHQYLAVYLTGNLLLPGGLEMADATLPLSSASSPDDSDADGSKVWGGA